MSPSPILQWAQYRIRNRLRAIGSFWILTREADSTPLNLEPARSCGVRRLRPATPSRTGCSPAQSAAVTAIPGVVFSGSVDGHLRAYSSSTGRVLWDTDTARDFPAVNGKPANGGSIDGAGPAIVNGMIFVNSGYGQWGGMSGNVLLAFSVQ